MVQKLTSRTSQVGTQAGPQFTKCSFAGQAILQDKGIHIFNFFQESIWEVKHFIIK